MSEDTQTAEHLRQTLAACRERVAELESRLEERQQVEEDLQIKAKAMASSLSPIAIADVEGRITYANPAFLEAWGYTSLDDVVGRPVLAFWKQEEEAARGFQQIKEQGGWTGEMTAERSDGTTFDVQVMANAIVDEEGRVKALMSSFLDLTARKAAEERVRQQWESVVTLIESFPEVLYVVDPETYEVILVNAAFEEALGADPVGSLCYEVFQGFDAPCEFCTNEIILETREPYTWEHHNPKLSRDYLITDQIVEWPDGRDVRFEVAVDITARRQAEDELRKHRQDLERLVEERTRTIQRQTKEILELSTPIMAIWEGVVAAPLIGTLDSRRTQRFAEGLLDAIVDTASDIALVDITGVPTIDTQTAQHLLETIAAVRLLGAQVVLTGVRPSIAQTLVHLGIDMSGIATHSSLASGLRAALETAGPAAISDPSMATD